jgi:hypothetical protein
VCFSLQWLENFIIWVIVVCAVVALIRLLIAFVIPHLGIGGPILDFVIRALWIVIWAVVCIAAVIFIFQLVQCLAPSVPRLR